MCWISNSPATSRACLKRSPSRLSRAATFRALIDKAGIVCTVKAGKGTKGRKVYSVGYHSLRHSFNSDLANLGVSQELRQKLIGHASEAVNEGYTTVELKTLRDAIHKLPNLQTNSNETS